MILHPFFRGGDYRGCRLIFIILTIPLVGLGWQKITKTPCTVDKKVVWYVQDKKKGPQDEPESLLRISDIHSELELRSGLGSSHMIRQRLCYILYSSERKCQGKIEAVLGKSRDGFSCPPVFGDTVVKFEVTFW